MSKQQRFAILAVVVLGVLIFIPAVLAGSSSTGLTLSPPVIEMGTFFKGARLTVIADIPPKTQTVMEVVGCEANEHLMRKGRRGGLYLNVGELEVWGVPKVYLVMSSEAGLLTGRGAEYPWGLEALRKKLNMKGDIASGEKEQLSRDFIRLKESEGLYATLPGAIKMSTGAAGVTQIQGSFSLPAKIPPGTYTVRLVVLQEGEVKEVRQAQFEVKMVGFPAFLAQLAYDQAVIYGLVAIVIAILAGALMGFLFKGGGTLSRPC